MVKDILYVLIAITNVAFIILSVSIDNKYYRRLKEAESRVNLLENQINEIHEYLFMNHD